MLLTLTLTAENWIGIAQTVIMTVGILFALRQLNLTVKQVKIAVSAATAAAEQTALAAKASRAAALTNIEAGGTDMRFLQKQAQ